MIPYKAQEVRVVLRPATEVVNRIAQQAVSNPAAAGLATGVTVRMAVKGFGMPQPWSALIGRAFGVFTTLGLARQSGKRLVQNSVSM